MNDLILTGYLEDNQLKVKIVKDTDEFWYKLIDNLKQKWERNTNKSTVEDWKKDKNIIFSERVLEHVAYWVLVRKEKLTNAQSKQKLKELDLYEKLKLVEHLF